MKHLPNKYELEYYYKTEYTKHSPWITAIGWFIIFLIILLGVCATEARPFNLCFTGYAVGESNGIVMSYGFYSAPTNSSGVYTYLGSVPTGHTNFWFDTTNLMPNPCYLTGQTVATNWMASTMSVPYLFDTNNYPVGTNPVVLILTAPTGFNVRTN